MGCRKFRKETVGNLVSLDTLHPIAIMLRLMMILLEVVMKLMPSFVNFLSHIVVSKSIPLGLQMLNLLLHTLLVDFQLIDMFDG